MNILKENFYFIFIGLPTVKKKYRFNIILPDQDDM